MTAIRARAMKLPRRTGDASRTASPPAPGSPSRPKYPSTMAVISTTSLWQPRSVTIASASARDAGEDVRYGMSTHSSLSAPIASAMRYATSPESIPPESASTQRSKPAWRSWPRMKPAMTLRATSVSIASSSGSSNRGRPAASTGRGRAAVMTRGSTPPRAQTDRLVGGALGTRIGPWRRRDIEPRFRAGIRRRVGRQPGALGDDPSELARLQLEPLVAQERQGDALAPDVLEVHVDEVQPLVEERRREDRLARRRDDLRAAPERDGFVDPDPIDEDHERRRQLGIGAHERPPRRRRPEPDVVARREVPARRRRDVEQDLGAVQGQQLWRLEMPEVLADGDPDAHAEPGRHRPQHVAGGEEPALVEETVGGQEHLAVDVPDLAVLHQCRRDEQAMVARFLHERHGRRDPPRRCREPDESWIVEAQRHLGREVLELVAGQAELGEDDQAGAAGTCLVEELTVASEVVLERAEARCGLGERDPEHGRDEDTPVSRLELRREPELERRSNRPANP